MASQRGQLGDRREAGGAGMKPGRDVPRPAKSLAKLVLAGSRLLRCAYGASATSTWWKASRIVEPCSFSKAQRDLYDRPI